MKISYFIRGSKIVKKIIIIKRGSLIIYASLWNQEKKSHYICVFDCLWNED